MPKQKSKEREKKERSMARIKFKRIAAIAMSAVLAVTSAPNLSLDFTTSAKAAETKAFGENTVDSVNIVAGYGSANSGDESITGNFEVEYSFTNKTNNASQAWFNYGIEIFSNGNYISTRADNFGWLAGGWKSDGSLMTWGDGLASWDDFKNSMKDASVKVTIKREDQKVTIINNIIDGSKTYKFTATCEMKNLPNTVSMHLTGEQVSLSNIKLVDKTDRDDDTPTTPQEISASNVTAKYNEYFSESNKKSHVSVHDPSVVIGYTDSKYTGSSSQKVYGTDKGSRQKVYFIFGSHRAFAWSTDMQNWTTFTNNINDDTKCQSLFKKASGITEQ